MRSKILIVLGALLVAGACPASLYTNYVNQVIPDAGGSLNPVSSTISVSGLLPTISDVNVYLNVSGGFNGDLYGYLRGPTGTIAILFNRVGTASGNAFGYSDPGFVIMLDDAAGTDIHLYGGNSGLQLTVSVSRGTWSEWHGGCHGQLNARTSRWVSSSAAARSALRIVSCLAAA